MTPTNHSPQQRWHAFRQQYIPTLNRRQQWLSIVAVGVTVILFVVLVLPFLLPLAGPKAQSPQALADTNGSFIEVNGATVYYQHAAGDGDAVLLVHGQSGSSKTWQSTMPALQNEGYDVYAIDLPGLGLSEKGLDLDYSHPAMADVLVGFMDELGLPTAHLVAHAFSGNIAVIAGQNHPGRILSLSLVAPTIITTPTTEIPPSILGLPFLERWIRVLVRWVLPEAVGEQLRSATKVDEVVNADLINDYSRVMSTEDWDLTAIGMIRDSHRNTIDGPLENMTMPVAIIWGTDDGWAPPEDGAWVAEAFPNAVYYPLEGIGHLPMHEVPSDFNAILISHLNNHTSIAQ